MLVTVFGLGNVGSQIAYQLVLDGSFSVDLIDSDSKALFGQYHDLLQAKEIANYPYTEISCPLVPRESDFYIICAGSKVEHGNDRNLLFKKNSVIVEEIAKMIAKVRKEDSITLMVTNPPTELTKLALDYIPNVLPVGNMLDNARLRLSKVSGSHEKPNIDDQYNLVKENKGHTCFGITTEVMRVIGRMK
jgi:malate/lactate dehydrogenase